MMKILVLLHISLFIVSIDGDNNYNISNVQNIIKGNSFTISHEFGKPIKYCWFLSPNNTFFPIHLNTSNPNYEYIGNGLSDGHCGIKIKNANFADSGKWKCKIGHNVTYDKEYIYNINVHETSLVAKRKQLYLANTLRLVCETFNPTKLEYCRFIGPNGRGIYPKIRSSRYSDLGTDLGNGSCTLYIEKVYGNDAGNWTCFAKPVGENVEYFDTFVIHHYPPNDISFWNVLTWILYVALISGIIIMASLVLFRLRVDASTSRQARPVISQSTM